MNRQFIVAKGFTLIELTVVMLLITLLASVAVRETSELAFQTRYEQTRERLEMIKQAILGNPRQIVNGQQAISGFAADMGRLPDNLRELLQMGYCVSAGAANPPLPADIVKTSRSPESCTGTNEWRWTNSPCTDGVSGVLACGAGGHLWLGRQNDQSTGLSFGWNGPYVSVSSNPADADAFTDGWGRLPQGYCGNPIYTDQASCTANGAAWTASNQDYNYGWYFNQIASNSLTMLNYGKDQIYDALATGYDIGFPALNAQPVIRPEDWSVDVSGGIKTQVKLPLNGTRQIPPVSFCTDANQTKKTDCEALPGKIWFGGCEDQTYVNKSSCVAAGKTWVSCSDGSSADKAACESAGAVWYGEGFGCEDQTKTTKADCTIAGKTWRSCTDNGTITTQSACAAANQLWYGDSIIAIGDNGGCSDIHYTNKTSCVAAGSTWHSCSLAGVANQPDCEAQGGYWLGNGYGCSDQQFSNQIACENNGNVWFESWPRCQKTGLPDTEALIPYHNVKTSRQACENDIGGSWKFPRKQICMRVFHRKNSGLVSTTSALTPIREDGANQTIQFVFPIYNNQLDCESNNGFWDNALGQCVYDIPVGQNAIGIYEHDGVNCTNIPYPADHAAPIQVDFHPHVTLPIINW